MSPTGPILLICDGFPPVRGIGGRRWAKFAKELARRGHTVHVIRNAARHDILDSLWTSDTLHPGIIQYPLPRLYPTVLTKRPLTSLLERALYRFWSKALPLLVPGNIYDSCVFWKRQLLVQSGKLIREHGIRNVIVTGAPFSLMAFATALKKPFPEIHLVADFRDVWTWGTDYGLGTMDPKRLQHEKDMEALVALKSDRLISPAKSITEHLHDTYGGAAERYVTIPHAIDPDDLELGGMPENDGLYRMIYAGSLYGAVEAEQYFDLLLQALENLRHEKPAVYANCRLDLYITGHDTSFYERLIERHGMSDHIAFHRPLPPKEIMKKIAASDLVLNFFPKNKKDIMATKFNEIFQLRRPILHVGEPGLVSRTIVERKLGDSLRVEELVTELPRIISGERPIEIDMTADHSEHLLAKITDRLISEVLV